MRGESIQAPTHVDVVPLVRKFSVLKSHVIPHRGRGRGHNLVDMALLVLRYSNTAGPSSPSLLPIACSLESGSHIQSIVTTNGFLGPGRYIILPLAFNHYQHTSGKMKASSNEGERGREGGARREEGAVPYVLAVFSARELVYENVTTGPGFLPESLMLLAQKTGRITEVGLCTCVKLQFS